MSVRDNPLATQLAKGTHPDVTLLATVMGLPLVDGIFPALILAGALNTIGGAIQVGLLVFSGSAATTIVLSELDGDFTNYIPSLAILGVLLTIVAMVEAALAPTIQSVINVATFERFAALVIFVIAAKTANSNIQQYLPSPLIIIALGLLGSITTTNIQLQFVTDPLLVVNAGGAALIGVVFTTLVAWGRETLLERIHLQRFRFGSAVSLALIGLTFVNLIPQQVPLGVFLVTCILAYDTTDSETDPQN